MNEEPDDRELLQRYAERGDEAAFGELVRRHLNLVYGCALRRLAGDAHLAEDVAQQVFCDLARRARTLAGSVVLSGWLYTSTRFAAAHAVRTEQRRRAREQTAMKATLNDGAQEEWERLRPVLDATIDGLEERDRIAIVLRFFEGRSFAEVGSRLRLTENAARMRVERALDKLHALLAARGIRSSAAALAVVLGGSASATAPAGLAGSVTTAALASGAGAAASAGTFMSTLQIGLAGALAVAGVAGFVGQGTTNAELEAQAASLRREAAEIRAIERESLHLRRLAAEVAELQRDDARFARLQEEATALRSRMQQVARAEQARERVYALQTLEQRPQPRFQQRPEYPAAMRKSGVEGEVVVDFVIDASGVVKDARALRSSRSEFDAAAVAAVSGWKFTPGVKGGVPVATQMQIPIVFSLAGTKAANASAPPKAPGTPEPFTVQSK